MHFVRSRIDRYTSSFNRQPTLSTEYVRITFGHTRNRHRTNAVYRARPDDPCWRRSVLIARHLSWRKRRRCPLIYDRDVHHAAMVSLVFISPCYGVIVSRRLAHILSCRLPTWAIIVSRPLSFCLFIYGRQLVFASGTPRLRISRTPQIIVVERRHTCERQYKLSFKRVCKSG